MVSEVQQKHLSQGFIVNKAELLNYLKASFTHSACSCWQLLVENVRRSACLILSQVSGLNKQTFPITIVSVVALQVLLLVSNPTPCKRL